VTTQAPAVATPGAPPVQSQDDRALAAAAHLSFLIGFWLVAPIAIYVIKRKESRFVALYAMQAAVVQILFAVGMGALMIAWVVLLAVAGASASAKHEVFAVLVAVVPILAMIGAGFLLLCLHGWAAFSAWTGRDFSIPVAGPIARAIMNADDGALKA
jgi:uncharacterized Tic20 family protein